MSSKINKLVVVESPAKSKTIKKYLGPGFEVLASYGHVRDLEPKSGAVDTAHDFAMKYQSISRNAKHVTAIAKVMKQCDTIYLATDPDREGEAIAWHVMQLLEKRGLLKDKKVCRVTFNQITKSAIQEAVAHPQEISMDLVEAQQARRALDYLVGFNLSPLLWRKITRGLSAGRVQSPALRLIAEREMEIEAFQKQEYWYIHALAQTQKNDKASPFKARLTHLHEKKLEQFSLTNEEQAQQALEDVQAAANGQLTVDKVTKKERKRRPAPPFITSTLQQEAARKLGFTAQRTMRTAQQLYEGIDVGEGTTGLITYMRTDSINLASEAIGEIRAQIASQYGAEKCPKEIRSYKTKSKNAQEAHEGIRPTAASRTPESIKSYLDESQYKLYRLIWCRTMASQMIDATLHTVAVDLKAGPHTFRANGSTIANPGFMEVYLEQTDDAPAKKESDEKFLPEMEQGEQVKALEITPDQHFTEPPPRYNEASLVKKLEEFGIGRPSTYASIISTLQNRKYVEMDQKRFIPTDTGRIVNDFLTKHFTQYVDYDFTAQLEDQLDAIARGEKERIATLKTFWEPFIKMVQGKDKTITRADAMQARVLGTDPKSGKEVSARMGRYGPFIQIGTRDDEDKPKFSSIPPPHKIHDITLEQALELCKLPREIGKAENGDMISAGIGRYGPYIKYGSKYASLGEQDDPLTVTMARALEAIQEAKEKASNKIILEFKEQGIQVLRGRYGPYITDGTKNAKIPKGQEPSELSLEMCQELIKAAPEKGKGRFTRRKKPSADT